MKKTLNINLAGLVFDIDEDAYIILKEYLDAISRHFEKNAGRDEIIADIENRIAEDFSQKRTSSKESITKDDVESVIHTMGRVEDFSSEDEDDTKNKKQETSSNYSSARARRLYRDTDNAILGGVASGIAKYFDVDPVLIRVLFVVFTFAGGFAIPLYIILWIITPKAETPLQKAEMSGEPITIKTIEKQVKEVVAEGKEKIQQMQKKNFGEKFAGFTKEVGTSAGRVFGRFFQIIGAIIGFFLSIGGFLGIIGLGIGVGILVVHRNSPELGVQIHNYISVHDFLLTAIFLTGAVFFPLLGVFLLGVRLMRQKPMMNGAIIALFILFWGASLIGSGVMIGKYAPVIEQMKTDAQVVGETKTISYDLADFHSVEASGNHVIRLVQGEKYSVVATGPENYLETVDVQRDADTLRIGYKERKIFCLFCHDGRVTITVTAPNFDTLEFHGATSASTEKIMNPGTMHVELSGASSFEGMLEAKQLELRESGASKITLTGKSESGEFEISGASQIDASQFLLQTLQLELNGASKAKVNVSQTLGGELSGASKLEYWGSPLVNNIELHGASKIENRTTTTTVE